VVCILKDDEGVVAFDIMREHPDIGYKSFEGYPEF
jgi:predicted RNA-binding protein